MDYTHLFNCACWHSKQAQTASDPKDRFRHEELAERLFIRAYWAKQRG